MVGADLVLGAAGRGRAERGWLEAVAGAVSREARSRNRLIGVLPGEGVGPEVTAAALAVLGAVSERSGESFEVRSGPPGGSGDPDRGSAPEPLLELAGGVLAAGGAVLAGAIGGRFVYDLRRRFDLFCKVLPIRPRTELREASRIRPEHLGGIDVLLVRENAGGVLQGHWSRSADSAGCVSASHSFQYTEPQVRRLLEAAVRMALPRRGRLAVLTKPAGIPSVSELWRETAVAVAAETGLELSLLDPGHAAYSLIQSPRELDVVASPNLLGDMLADVGEVLLGSRALACSANLGASGAAVYQTNHGRADDLAGTDRANPAGQILALAALLRESCGLPAAAEMVEAALTTVWQTGWRTADLAVAGAGVLGTAEFGQRVALAVLEGHRPQP